MTLLISCADESATTTSEPAATVESTPVAEGVPVDAPPTNSAPAEPMIPSISIGGGDTTSTVQTPTKTDSKADAKAQRESLLAAMNPLQVMLGAWKGTTQKVVGDFKALDKPNWVWDFQTDRSQPAMVMKSEESPYFREVRLTYLTDKNVFQLTSTDPEGKTRTYQGDFSAPVEEFEGDDENMHVKYKLKLDQIDAESKRDKWQLVFNQQENNRYLLELYRGPSNLRFDTVATQREGTSFAKSDVGYGDKECIISGGLGTIQVSHNGKNYWVCCTGCKAAFEEDPTSWIAEYEEKQAKKAAAGS